MLGATTDSPHFVRVLGPRVTDVSVRPRFLVLLLASALLAAACTTPVRPVAPAATLELAWQEVTLPGGITPVTLATDGSRLLVGAHGPGRPHARLLSVGPSGTLTDVPLTPRSPYAFEGLWFQVVTRDGRVDAIAGARGGAHGNYRWTTWSGTEDGVAEQEQPFGVFGSYGAGDLAGMAYAGASPVILGAWQSQRTGLDIAVWTRSAERWTRHRSTDTPLGSTAQEVVSATSIASRGQGVVLSGSVTHLEPGSVRVEPAIWTSPGQNGPWTRTGLPYGTATNDTAPAEAQGATCAGQRCLVSGTAGGRFSLWVADKDTVSQPAGIPEIVLPENTAALPPVLVGEDVVVVVPSGGGSTIVRRSGSSWSVGDGPQGTPVSALRHGDELWVVTTSADGSGSLVRSRLH